jgi:conjugal transfer mating pair stabilization protein TraN
LFGCIAVKEVYCCFQSPFARIFQEQARPQLGINFGTPKAPSCGGLSINQIKKLNFKAMDFSEWVGMLSTANMLPTSINQANLLYNLNSATSTKLPNTAGPNALSTTTSKTKNMNGDAIRQYLLNNLQ